MGTKSIFVITMIITVFGLVMVSSAGIIQSQKNFGSSYYYLKHQLIFGFLPGLIGLLVASKINYKFWQKIALPLLIFVIGLVVLVFVPGIGYSIRGAARWIDLRYFLFQPSEALKIALVMYLAAWFSKNIQSENKNEKASLAIIPFSVVLAFVFILLAAQPDFGTLGVIGPIALLMFFVAGGKIKHLIYVGVACLIIFAVLSVIEPYRFNRLSVFINPNTDPQGIGYHLRQSLIAIGSGGLLGKGIGRSTQKLGFLPEPMGDSIFAIIAEELGLIGSLIVISLFIILVAILLIKSSRLNDKFGRLLVAGIAIWIGLQSAINIGASVGAVPFTGIPLPFISYGGTSLVILMSVMGIVINVVKNDANTVKVPIQQAIEKTKLNTLHNRQRQARYTSRRKKH